MVAFLDRERTSPPWLAGSLAVAALFTAWFASILLGASANFGFERRWDVLNWAVPFTVAALVLLAVTLWLFGLRPRIVLVGGPLVLLVVVGLTLGGCAAKQPDKTLDAASNRSWIEAVPHPPGSELVGAEFEPFIDRSGGEGWFEPGFIVAPSGYRATTTYRLPYRAAPVDRLEQIALGYATRLRERGYPVRRSPMCGTLYFHPKPCVTLVGASGNAYYGAVDIYFEKGNWYAQVN